MPGSQPAPHERVYVFHGGDSTQVFGPSALVSQAHQLLAAAGITPHVSPATYPDIAARPYTSEALQDPLADAPSGWSRSHTNVGTLAVELPAPEFWDRISAGSWATWSQRWPSPANGVLFPPRSPEWLTRAPRWELDPLAPALGPAAAGGWLPYRDQQGAHDPGTAGAAGVGLFQLTDVESFWVLSSPERLDRVVALCERLSAQHPAFTWLTGYFDPRDVVGSLRLPMECARELEYALTERDYAVDVWW